MITYDNFTSLLKNHDAIRRLLGDQCPWCKKRFMAEDAVFYDGELWHKNCLEQKLDPETNAIRFELDTDNWWNPLNQYIGL